jgi:hypothetical protein
MYAPKMIRDLLLVADLSPNDGRKVVRSRLWWLEDAENDLREIQVKRWR